MIAKKKSLLPIAASMCALAGCATGRLDAQWSDPQFASQPLGGAKVLVVCQAAEQTVVRICQDQLAEQLRAVGITPVMSESLTLSADKATDRIPAARSLGAQAIMQATLSPVTVVNNSGSAFGVGFGSGGYHSGVGFGMSVPFGSNVQTTSTSYSSDTTLINVASGKLMWSGKASTMSQEVPDQIASLVKISVESARKAGMI